MFRGVWIVREKSVWLDVGRVEVEGELHLYETGNFAGTIRYIISPGEFLALLFLTMSFIGSSLSHRLSPNQWQILSSAFTCSQWTEKQKKIESYVRKVDYEYAI